MRFPVNEAISFLADDEGCCKAMTAKCMACSVGKTVAELCKHHPQFDGCNGIF